MINKLSTLDADFDSQLASLTAWDTSANQEISNSVKSILSMKTDMKSKLQEIGREVIFNYFTKINEKTISVFN